MKKSKPVKKSSVKKSKPRKKKVAKKPKARKRISEFEWKRNGVTQSLNEEDFFDRESFLKERASFKRAGIKVKDKYTTKPYIPYRFR